MRLILTIATLVCLSLSSQAMASGQDMYCSSNDVSATLFLQASRNQYVYKPSAGGAKIVDSYNAQSTQVADNGVYAIQIINGNQALVVDKSSGLQFVLSCR